MVEFLGKMLSIRLETQSNTTRSLLDIHYDPSAKSAAYCKSVSIALLQYVIRNIEPLSEKNLFSDRDLRLLISSMMEHHRFNK